MAIISVICFSLLLLLILSLFRKGADLFSPGRIFLIVWTLAIGLTELKLSRLQYDWSIYSWITLMVSLFSTLLGIYIVYVIHYGKSNVTIKKQRGLFGNLPINSKKLFRIIVFVAALYIISYVIIYAIIGFIPLFTPRPDISRSKWSIFGLGLIIHVVPSIIYFVVLYFIVTRKQIFRKLFLFAVATVCFLSFVFLVQRFDLIIAVVVSAVYLFYATNKLNLRNAVLFILLAGVLLYGISTLRTSSVYINLTYIFSEMKFGYDYAVFTEPYMYICMNLENFAHASDGLSSFSYGFFTFDFLLALTGIKHLILEYANIQEFPGLITPNYNTFTMYFAFYRDFGLLGSFILSAGLGALFGKLYFNLKYNSTLSNLSLYGLFVFVIIFSFFIPMISLLHFVLNISLIYFVSKMAVNDKI